MIICHSKRFIFIKTAKTAGTSIEAFLNKGLCPEDISTPFSYPEEDCAHTNYSGRFPISSEIVQIYRSGWQPFGIELMRTLADWKARRAFYGHIPAWRVRSRLGINRWSSYYKFAVERNPWDKVISAYWYKKNMYGPADLTFNQFIDFLEYQKTTRRYGVGVSPFNLALYADKKKRILVDRVIKYESLDAGLRSVFKTIGINPDFSSLEYCAKTGFRGDRRPYTEFYSLGQKERVRSLFEEEINIHGYEF